jgi:citrate lyase subunit beta/citryl-CoA lyase
MGFLHNTDMRRFMRRSTLTFPVNVPRFVQKAYSRGADCYVIDLEDSVPEGEKALARTLIKESIPTVGKGGADVAVRINRPMSLATRDLEASIWPGLACVSLPKVESADEVRSRDEIITELERRRGLKEGSVQIAVAVETAIGVLRAFEIASSSLRIVTMSVGAEDLTREMGVQTTREGHELWYAQSKVLMDAHAAGVHPMGIVGVEPFSWEEPEKIYEAAAYSRKIGFKGGGSIHPAPIPYINRGFSVPEEEVAYARRALEAFDVGVKKGTASVEVDGRMVDIATAERCKTILERADAIANFEARKAEAQRSPEDLEERLKAAIKEAEKRET